MTFQEQTNTVRSQEMLCIPKQFGQGRAGPGRDDIEMIFGAFFHPPVLNCDGQIHRLGGGGQERAFLGGCFKQSYPNPVPQQFRQHQARKPRSGAQIRQGSGGGRNQGRQLGRIPEMPPPKVFQGTRGNQIVAGIPVQQKVRVALEAHQCFT